MFFKEHGIPHFQARYDGQIAVFAIEPLELLRGSLPSRAGVRAAARSADVRPGRDRRETGTISWPTGADLDPIVICEGLPPLNARVVREAAA